MNKHKKNYYIVIFMIAAAIIVTMSFHFNSKATTETADAEYKYVNEGIPVLMYHSIGKKNLNPMIIPTDKFSEQMKFLKENDYTTLTLDEVYNFFAGNIKVPKKSVVITFDDGYVDNYTNAYPILKKYKFNATIFLISDGVDKGNAYINSQQIKEMSQNGIQIESHTTNHCKLSHFNYDEQFKNLNESKEAIEKISGKKVKYLAYPYGKYNEDTIKAAQNAGYLMAFKADPTGKWAYKSSGMYTLDRIYVNRFFSIKQYKDRISNPEFNLID